MMRRVLLVLALVGLILLTVVAFAMSDIYTEPKGPVKGEYQSGDYRYSLVDNGTYVEIEDYTGTSGDVVIPSIIDGKSVTSIGAYAFSDNIRIKSVIVPSGVTRIDFQAFARCSFLAQVTIPNSVTTIGKAAFSDCTNLTSIDLPDNMTSIAESTFMHLTGFAAVAALSLVSVHYYTYLPLTPLGMLGSNRTMLSKYLSYASLRPRIMKRNR